MIEPLISIPISPREKKQAWNKSYYWRNRQRLLRKKKQYYYSTEKYNRLIRTKRGHIHTLYLRAKRGMKIPMSAALNGVIYPSDRPSWENIWC